MQNYVHVCRCGRRSNFECDATVQWDSRYWFIHSFHHITGNTQVEPSHIKHSNERLKNIMACMKKVLRTAEMNRRRGWSKPSSLIVTKLGGEVGGGGRQINWIRPRDYGPLRLLCIHLSFRLLSFPPLFPPYHPGECSCLTDDVITMEVRNQIWPRP